MGEYDNLTRTLEATTPPKPDQDDPSFANKMAKCVAMLNNGIYTKVRGRKLDKIFIVVNGGSQAVENRLKVIRACGGENAFFVVSLNVLTQLTNQSDVLTAPVWRKAADAQERYYPLIGQSWWERLEQLLRQCQIPPAKIATELAAVEREAKRRLHRAVLAELNEAQLERVKNKRARNGQASKLLRSFYTQRKGQTYAQGLAIFADKMAERLYKRMQQKRGKGQK